MDLVRRICGGAPVAAVGLAAANAEESGEVVTGAFQLVRDSLRCESPEDVDTIGRLGPSTCEQIVAATEHLAGRLASPDLDFIRQVLSDVAALTFVRDG